MPKLKPTCPRKTAGVRWVIAVGGKVEELRTVELTYIVSGREFFATWRPALRPSPSSRWDRSTLLLLLLSSQLSQQHHHRSYHSHVVTTPFMLTSLVAQQLFTLSASSPAIRRRHCDFGLPVWSEVCDRDILHHIYNLYAALGTKMKWLHFEVKGQGHD